MKLSKILIYPIKSLAGISLETNKLEEKGLQNDRRWMLVDENNKFMTVRKYPKMLFFSLQLQGNGFSVWHDDQSIDVPFVIEGETQSATVWDDEVSVIVGDENWNTWFSQKLGINCKLVYFPEDSPRPSGKKWSEHEANVNLSDEHPLLVVGTASLHDLNQKMSESIEMDRFRPNLVFEGGQAYEEYRWDEFMVGNINFKGLKPCTRCMVTTLDISTGKKGAEPLKTLSNQKINNKVIFGQHALALEHNTIEVGDEIKVIRYKDSPYDRS